MPDWPAEASELESLQFALARLRPDPFVPAPGIVVGGCFCCFARGQGGKGSAGDPGWAAAVAMRHGRVLCAEVVMGMAHGPYEPGLLAIRDGPLLHAAVAALPVRPDCLLVNATGLDHPRRAGLALHLGVVLGIPTVGVTDRTLLACATGVPGQQRGDSVPVLIEGQEVGRLVRLRPNARPVVIHAAWRTTPDQAAALVLSLKGHHRTPEPLRRARALARSARSAA